jgi:hypothetical protein
VFCAEASMGVARGARSEKRHVPLVIDATALGNRWTILAGSRVMSGWVCDPGGLESAPSGTAGILASILGRTAGRTRQSGAAGVGRARTG